MKQSYKSKQLTNINNKEQRILNRKSSVAKQRMKAPIDKISNKIPPKLSQLLETAFYNAFKLVFQKGSGVIEKTYHKDTLKEEFEINHFAVTNHPSRKRFRNLDKTAAQSNVVNTACTTAIGTGLGLLGIGLPDIPVFMSIMIRQLYQTALSYGFDYESEEEKLYMLYLIQTSISEEESRAYLHEQTTILGSLLNRKEQISYVMDSELQTASKALSKAMLTAKFIQGIPLVGAVGGLANHVILNKISKYARLQYKKRYLTSLPSCDPDMPDRTAK